MHNSEVDTRRLEFLLELSRLGSMARVAEQMRTTTSTVSQQIAKLAQETATTLVEPDGRRVRLTPAGHRLAAHAAVILGAVEAARVDLDPAAEPVGTLRVAGGATLITRTLLPVVRRLAASHPDIEVQIYEYEPDEALAGLATDDIDLALTYDYSIVPLRSDPTVETFSVWSRPWSLGVRAGTEPAHAQSSLEVMTAYADEHWIGNSRNTADEDVMRLLGALAGFEPRVSHQFDSLDLVQELIVEGFGVGLLPADLAVRPGVALVPLTDPAVVQRAFAQTRRGRRFWPPLALLLAEITTRAPA
jgi:DNA-binding transcriptional LysR family regulator